MTHSYRRRHLNGLGGYPEYLRSVTAMAKHAPVSRILRPAHPLLPDALADEVERHLRAERRSARADPVGRSIMEQDTIPVGQR